MLLTKIEFSPPTNFCLVEMAWSQVVKKPFVFGKLQDDDRQSICSTESEKKITPIPLIHTIKAQEIVDMAFNYLCPKQEYKYIFLSIQELYRAFPERFTIESGLHQNNKNDTLHISVKYTCANEKFYCIYHINGYLNVKFYITDITTLQFSQVYTVAEF